MKNTLIILFVIAAFLYGGKLKAQETQDFCSSLKFLMEAAKDTFITVKGPMVKEQEEFLGKTKRYASKRSFEDADSTYIQKAMKISHVSIMGSDSFHSSRLVNMYYDLAEKINACLGPGWKYEEIKDEMNHMLIYKVQKNSGKADDMQHAVVYVKLNDSEKMHTLTLEIEEPFFKKKKTN